MEIKDDHKELLRGMGLKDEDFKLFGGIFFDYEYDDEKGVRIYDPYYRTSYNEYIGVDGWSSWSYEEDTFMSDILKGVNKEASRRSSSGAKPSQEEISQSLREKFREKISTDDDQ